MTMNREMLLERLQNQYLTRQEVLFRLPLNISIDSFWPELVQRRKLSGVVLPLHRADGKPLWYVLTNRMIAASERLCALALDSADQIDPYKAELTGAMTEELFFTGFVEGAQISLQEAMEFLGRGTEPENVQEQLIQNNRNAWSDMLGALYYPLDERFVRQLAHQLTDEMEGHAGDYRQTDTHTIAAMGSESYSVPSSADIPGLMQEYYAFLGSAEVHPLIKAAVGQAFLLIARPFPDGNERLSRMISYAVLLRSGYDFFRDISISAVIAKEGYRYYKSMQDVIRSESDGDLTYFIEYYLDLLARSIDEKAEQEQRRQRDALLRERKLAATPLGGDRPPEKEPRASAPDEDTIVEAEAAAETADNAETPLLPDESPPVQLYTYEEYLSLLNDTRKKHMSRIQPERVERLCSRLEEFARNGPHLFRRAQWAELTGIPLGTSKEDVFLMNKFGLICCENIAESRSRAIKIYRIPLIPGERQPESEAPSEDAGIRETLKRMLNSEYSRERQVAAGLLDMLDQGKQEFNYAEWNSRNPATSKDSGFAVLRVGMNRGLIEFDEGTYRIVPKIKSGPQCYPMPDKQRDVLLRLMDAFPNECFTVRDASEAAGSKYSTTGYYLENFTQRGILKVEKKPGYVNRYEFSNEVHGIFKSLETDGETARFQEEPPAQKEIHDPMQGMADAG